MNPLLHRGSPPYAAPPPGRLTPKNLRAKHLRCKHYRPVNDWRRSAGGTGADDSPVDARVTSALDPSAYPDDFARRGLPPAGLWPVIDHEALGRLNYPKRLNAAVELLDRAVERGLGPRPCVRSPQATWSYAELLENGQPDRRRAGQRDGACSRQPRAAPLGKQSDAGGVLVRRAQGRRYRGHDHAAAAGARAWPDLQQGRAQLGTL